jgi:hypothetical protein
MLRPARKDSALAPHPVNGQGQGRHESCPRVDDPKRGLTQNLIRAREVSSVHAVSRGFCESPTGGGDFTCLPKRLGTSARLGEWGRYPHARRFCQVRLQNRWCSVRGAAGADSAEASRFHFRFFACDPGCHAVANL